MEKMIDIIKQYPILWNTDARDYRDANKKNVAWKKVVQALNNPDIPNVQSAKNEWKKLRDSHRESIKRVKAHTSDDVNVVNHWRYADLMDFLVPYIKTRKRTYSPAESRSISPNPSDGHSIVIVGDHHDETGQTGQSDDSYLTPELSSPKEKKIRVEDSLHVLLKEDDSEFVHQIEHRDMLRTDEEESKRLHPLNLFFESMCESTKKLPDWIQRDVKKKLLNIVSEAEETYENYITHVKKRSS